MFTFLINLFKKKPKEHYSVSFDSSIKLDSIPVKIPTKPITFCTINKDLKLFEVVNVDHTNKTIRMSEVGTDNEFDIDFTIYDYLFVEEPQLQALTKQK